MKKLLVTILTVILAVPLFAQTTDDHAKTKKGAAIGGSIGAVVGAVLGNNRGHHSAKRGAVVGGVTGAAAGAIIGATMDKQEREVPQIPDLSVNRTADDELHV